MGFLLDHVYFRYQLLALVYVSFLYTVIMLLTCFIFQVLMVFDVIREEWVGGGLGSTLARLSSPLLCRPNVEKPRIGLESREVAYDVDAAHAAGNWGTGDYHPQVLVDPVIHGTCTI